MEESEETERRLMAQLTERSEALAASVEEIHAARAAAAEAEEEATSQRAKIERLTSKLEQAQSDGSVALAHVERLESDIRQRDSLMAQNEVSGDKGVRIVKPPPQQQPHTKRQSSAGAVSSSTRLPPATHRAPFYPLMLTAVSGGCTSRAQRHETGRLSDQGSDESR